ncbi:MAG: class II fructose-bisphosphate aldolase [Clostridia bacterium]|nr:class II fructose-bisphosphate aldolase [Clostridia bacterium]MBR5044217.1 class II fructose-bisphosphate aldolase [Clostridia bacterium]
MLVNLKTVLSLAEAGGYAIPAFNVYNMETVMGAVKAAEELRAPVILQVYPRLMKEETGYYLSPVILAAANRATVPVCFHLDHGPSELETTRSIRYGATGIMLDGSTLPFEENIALTRRVVETCAYLDVQVEGELGHVGMTSDKDQDEFTTPEDAKTFIEKTGVACLAVAVGTAHGRYKKPPKLDIERIKAIRQATGGAALVLHGGSGVPDEEIKKGVAAGIRKMNFATDVCYAFLDCCLNELQKPDRPVAVDSFMKRPIEAVTEFCMSRIKLVGADGKV